MVRLVMWGRSRSLPLSSLGVRAYHKLEEDGATAGIPHLSVKFLLVCLSNIRKDGAGYLFLFAAFPVGEVSKVCFDLPSVSYVPKRYNCHFVFTSSARGGYVAPWKRFPAFDPERL